MPLTKLQKIELKKIEHCYKRIERFSEKNGIELNECLISKDFRFEDQSEANRQLVFEQSRTRSDIFKSENRKSDHKALPANR